MKEIELKFLLDETAARHVMAGVKRLAAPQSRAQWRKLTSVYYDTPDHALKAAGIALRLRRMNRRWVQTVKVGAAPRGGLQSVGEWECVAPGGRLALDLVAEPDVRADIEALVGDSDLAPVCETVVRRSTSVLSLEGGASAEVAIDVGEVRAGGASAPLIEAEFELLSGTPGALYELAGMLVPEPALRLSRLSKAGRGYLLAREGVIEPPLVPRFQAAVPLTAEMTAEQAAREVLRECFEQIAINAAVVCASDDPEGPHQLRVGLRRLRSALILFEGPLACPQLGALREGLRTLGRAMGRLRDLEAILGDVVAPLGREHAHEPGFRALAAALGEEAQTERARARAHIRAPHSQAFLLDLARFIETRGWLLSQDLDQTVRLAEPVDQLAARMLDARWRKVEKRAKRIETLGVEARHDLRKALKMMRYVADFAAPLYSKKRVSPFLKSMRRLQTVFGSLNDVAAAHALLDGPAAPGADSLAVQRASGWVIGASLERSKADWADAKAAWRELSKGDPFWR